MKGMLAIIVLLSGCKVIEAGKYAPPTGWVPPDSGEPTDTAIPPEVDPCDDAPLVNWNNFGGAFMTESCTGCHHSEVPDRYGAPEGINFDTRELVWAQRGMILYTATGDEPAMPPQGGTTDMDRQLLEYWLNCAPECT